MESTNKATAIDNLAESNRILAEENRKLHELLAYERDRYAKLEVNSNMWKRDKENVEEICRELSEENLKLRCLMRRKELDLLEGLTHDEMVAFIKATTGENGIIRSVKDMMGKGLPINAPCRIGKGSGPKRATTQPAPSSPQGFSPVDKT